MNEFIETSRGLKIDGNPSYSKADMQARALQKRLRETPIHIGDLLNYAKLAYGEQFSQLTAYFPDRQSTTLANYMSVTKSVPYEVRPDGVRFSQLDAVRTLADKPDMQREILQEAVENDWGYEEIRAHYGIGSEKLPPVVCRESLPIPSDFRDLYQLAFDILERLLGLAGGEQKEKIEKALSCLRELG
jgi:hypothetical protein